jgi:DNA-binding HTH domain-containing proteins
MGGFKFEKSLYNQNVGNSEIYYYIWLFTGCAFSVFLDGRKFVSKTFYSVITALVCFISLQFTGVSFISRIIMVIAAACIGHISASSIYGFFMVLNNAEKFYSMIAAVLLPKVLMFAKPTLKINDSAIDMPSIIIFIVILILAVCSYFYKHNLDELPRETNIKAPKKAYALMPLIFVVLVINDVVAPAALSQITDLPKNTLEGFYFLGIIIGIFVFLVLQIRFKINICNMLNISFALLAVGFVVDIISFQSKTAALFAAVCFGSSYVIGFVNIYYLAGFMTKKFQSVPFYRIGIALATLYYFLAFIVTDLYKDNVNLSPTFLALASVCIVIFFFILTPFFIRVLYTGEWIEDSYRRDVTRCSRLEAKLLDYKLTAAEMEVCKLLLEGYTLRQISAIESKAYATVNTYCTSIYRKLKINSRTELLILLRDYVEK